MQIYNHAPPSVLIKSEGQIVICNDKFEKLITDRLGAKMIPANLVEFIQKDKESQRLLQENISNCKETKKPQSFDITLDETITTIKTIEGFKVNLSSIKFGGQSCFLLSFETITD